MKRRPALTKREVKAKLREMESDRKNLAAEYRVALRRVQYLEKAIARHGVLVESRTKKFQEQLAGN